MKDSKKYKIYLKKRKYFFFGKWLILVYINYYIYYGFKNFI